MHLGSNGKLKYRCGFLALNILIEDDCELLSKYVALGAYSRIAEQSIFTAKTSMRGDPIPTETLWERFFIETEFSSKQCLSLNFTVSH